MKWLIPVILCLIPAWSAAAAERYGCEKSEAACILDAAWSAALILPEDKLDRLAPAFLDLARDAGEPGLLDHWESRLGATAPPPQSYPDFGWQRAAPLLRQGGPERLIQVARERAEPLNFGRADALLSAGKRLQNEDAAGSEALNDALMEFARAASAFEKPSLAHAAAELAMVRCDRARFERALLQTDAPGNLRYAIWRARIDGDVLPLLDRIRGTESDQDTREVRRVLEGYRAILELGYCNARIDPIGG
jgi:hypothetical protein